MNDIIITSDELKDKNKKEVPQKASEFSKYSFWYYTSFKTADLILKNSEIYISNITKMNDIEEKELHNENGCNVHCLCLCNSDTEKIPMWYLYSGIAGNGTAIGFTPSVLIKLIESIEKLTAPDGMVLFKGKDFDIEYGWVFYRKSINQICYKRKWYHLKDPKNFENNNYFIKAYPWEYEKEFRIVIHNKSNEEYDYLKLDISPIFKDLKIRLAPEISEKNMVQVLPQRLGFLKLLSSKISYSKLGINMNLCKRNIDSFINYIEMNIERATSETGIDTKRICKAIASKCECKREDNESKTS